MVRRMRCKGHFYIVLFIGIIVLHSVVCNRTGAGTCLLQDRKIGDASAAAGCNKEERCWNTKRVRALV